MTKPHRQRTAKRHENSNTRAKTWTIHASPADFVNEYPRKETLKEKPLYRRDKYDKKDK
jgi:hypothetical protein